jgi:hypothetical protein
MELTVKSVTPFAGQSARHFSPQLMRGVRRMRTVISVFVTALFAGCQNRDDVALATLFDQDGRLDMPVSRFSSTWTKRLRQEGRLLSA